MSSRKRSGSGSKRPKEKVVYIYEMLLRLDFEDPAKNNAEFWNEFFLLQPNVEVLETELTKLSFEQLIALKRNINLLFTQSIELLDSGWCVVCVSANFHSNHSRSLWCVYSNDYPCILHFFQQFSDHPKRLCNSLQTLCALFYSLILLCCWAPTLSFLYCCAIPLSFQTEHRVKNRSF